MLVKGAVERMLDLCGAQMDTDGTVRALDRATVLRAADELAGRGLRVLATAMRRAAVPDEFGPDEFGEEALAGSLVLTGLQAMLDPPRAAATAAVAACQTARISVKMITGDHAATARRSPARSAYSTITMMAPC